MNWLYLLIFIPMITGMVAWLYPSLRGAEKIHLAGSFLFFVTGVITILQIYQNEIISSASDFIYADTLSAWFILMIVVIGFLSAVYSYGYMREEQKKSELADRRYRRYYLFFHLFLASMLLVTISNNLGIVWVAIELTTLVSALLVAHDSTGTSLEAAWKYLIIGSVGIAFALIGIILLYEAGTNLLGESPGTLHWTQLMSIAKELDANLLKYAFIFILIGFGTKAGLAPMHFWLPDAHSQAPTPVSALLSGVLLNTAIFGILRVYAIVHQTLESIDTWFILLGALTVVISVPFLLIQKDIKRLLAYSSVEHVGIIFFGIGIGGPIALYGTLLHMLNHALTKTLLFFSVGHIVSIYHTKWINRIEGVYKLLPITGVVFFIGLFAITGSPPFGAFISEYHILLGGINDGHVVSTTMVFISIVLIFAGMVYYGSKMILGNSEEIKHYRLTNQERKKEDKWMTVPMLLLVFIVFLFGLYIPYPIDAMINRMMMILQGGI